MRLDASPTVALWPGARIVTGCEDDPDEPGCVRLYLDHRYRQRFVLVPPESAAEARRAWEATAMCHLFARLDPGEPVFVDCRAVAETEWAHGGWDERL